MFAAMALSITYLDLSYELQVRADANMKAELAAEEGRLLCTQCRTEMFPDEEGFYEFERRGGGRKRKTEEEVSSRWD